ncbi:response regulator transcription factor [Pontiellaceae bacterium B1224]|nr:response regulator transcription factor [Pontiellaceae bacterium B1224]
METLLIIEDEPHMLRALKDNFSLAGYQVITASDGEEGLNAALDTQPDLILLDIMLPTINGYEICRLIRDQGLDMPIIMLTAKGEETDIVLGLNLGADDYVTKPFGVSVLRARVAAFLRRRKQEQTTLHEFDGLQLDLDAHRLSRDNEEIKLSPQEFRLLAYLVENLGRVLTRDTLLNGVWGYNCFVGPRNIDRFITSLRNKVERDPKQPRCIHTVRGFGYKFEPPKGIAE